MASWCIFLGFVAVAVDAVMDDACVGKEDGIYGSGCVANTQCKDGLASHVDCSPNVFNPAIQACDLRENTPPPCGSQMNCRWLPDMSFPRKDDGCKSFYTCQDGADLGSQLCNPGLVFNVYKQVCDWPYNVFPPCGTK